MLAFHPLLTLGPCGSARGAQFVLGRLGRSDHEVACGVQATPWIEVPVLLPLTFNYATAIFGHCHPQEQMLRFEDFPEAPQSLLATHAVAPHPPCSRSRIVALRSP